jgi:transcriptional regulator with XRE-family HTH domain
MSNNYLFGNRNQFVGSAFAMNERAKIVGKNIARLREERGLSQAQLAKAIDVKSQNTVAAIESGKTQKSKHLHDIARVLKVSITDIDPQSEVTESPILSASDLVGDRDLKVFASAEAGDGALVLTNEPVDMVRRPEPLANVRKGYGVIAVGESMVPAVRPGDVLLVNPHLPPRAEDVCLFIFDHEGEFRATIKEYCSQSPDAWKVKRYKPEEKTFTLRKKDWPKCHVVVGKYNRR